MSQKKFNRVFYTPASAKNAHPRSIDYVLEREDGTLVGAYSHKTIEEMANDYGTEVLVMDCDAYHAIEDQSYVTAPGLIDRETYESALNCLPPMNWGTWLGVESFRLSEFYIGRITTIYARTNDGRYWRFMDDGYQSGESLAEKVIAAARKLDEENIPAWAKQLRDLASMHIASARKLDELLQK